MSGSRQASTITERSRLSDSDERTVVSRGRKDSIRSRTPTLFSRSRSRGRAEEKRPGTARTFSHSKSRSREEKEGPKRQLSSQPTRSTSHRQEAAKDLTILPPPQSAQFNYTTVNGDPSMIGLALGSPSQLQPTYPGSPGQTPRGKVDPELATASDHYVEDPTHRNKGARWRKIGGLFKAKNSLLNEQSPSPFNQSPVQYATQSESGTDPSYHSNLAGPGPGPGDHDARNLFDKILGSDGQLAPQKYTNNPLPLLDIQIPDIQLERYSVMFGSLLDKQESSTLLSRRDKTLNRLMTIPDEKERPPPGHPAVPSQQLNKFGATPNPANNSHLTPHGHATYHRRATSPTSQNSPSFSLFPPLPQAAARTLGPLPPAKPIHLQRSLTAPSRLSPMQESFEFDDVGPWKLSDTRENMSASPPQTASISDPERASSDPSVPSPASTRSSLTEDLLLNIKTFGSLKRRQDDHVNEYSDLKVAPLKPLPVANNALTETIGAGKVEKEAQKVSNPATHEDTLAALERPRSVEFNTRDLSSLKPSKARIDQIMRGPPADGPSKAAAEARKGKSFPRNAESEVKSESLQKVVTTTVPGPQIGSDAVEATVTVATSPTGKEKSAMTVRSQEALSVPRHAHLTSRDQTIQQPSGTPGFSMLDGSTSIETPERQSSLTTHYATNAGPISNLLPARKPLQSSHSENRGAGQSINGQSQEQSFASKTPCESYHETTSFTANPSLNTSTRSFRNHMPPQDHDLYPRTAFNRMHPPQGPVNHPIKTPKMQNDRDSIVDYYLDDQAGSPSQLPRWPRKLPKQRSNKPRPAFSPGNNPFPAAMSPLTSSDTGPRSPIPISKYSVNAAHKPLISPKISSTAPLDPRSELHSYLDSVHSSCTPTYSYSISVSNPPLQPRQPVAEFDRAVDAYKTDNHTIAKGEMSFFLHSNGSTPTLESAANPLTQASPATAIGRPGTKLLSQSNNAGLHDRSSSRGGSLSSLPSRAGDIDSRSTGSKPMPPQPTRSASAGMARSGSATGWYGIQGHLKPERGEKVVERQAGLVPTIVDPQRHPKMTGFTHHRMGKSVNVVIESSKITAVTGWYETYLDVFKKGQFTFRIQKWHEEYGPIIRINPTEIHISDPDFFDIAYSSTAPFNKPTAWRNRFGLQDGLHATVEHELHHRRRMALNPYFSKKKIADFSPQIQHFADKLCNRLLREYRGTGKPVTLNDVWAAYTTDVAIFHTFDWTYDFLDFPDFKAPFTQSTKEMANAVHFSGHFPWVPKALQSLPDALLGVIYPPMRPILQFQNEVTAQIVKIMNEDDEARKTGSHTTVVSNLLASSLPPQELSVHRLTHEVTGLVAAAIETTRATLTLASFHLLDKPDILRRLRQELEEAFPDLSKPPTLTELERLPYLTAVIQESLRLSYGVAQRLPRISPHSPLIYNSTYTIPAGTVFSMSAYLQHHSTSIFPDSHTFSPDRWLNNKSRTAAAANDRPLSRYLVSFSKGTRSCLGHHLAWAELYIGLANVVRRLELELYETSVQDVQMKREYFVAQAAVGSKGVRVLVK